MSSCFLHIPKTGGSWLSSAIRTSLAPHEFHEVPSERVGLVPLRLLLKRYAVVAGHFTVAHLAGIPDETFTFSVLRDPIERVVSLYYFYRQQILAAHHDPRVALAQALDFETFVTRLQDRVSPWSNWQTFVFSGATDCETPANDLLPAALENLDRIDFVGVQDDLADSVSALAALRGWRVTPPRHRINVSSDRPLVRELTPSVLRKLKALNEADTVLFRRARERSASMRNCRVAVTSHRHSNVTWPPVRASEAGTKQIVITRADADVRHGMVVVQAQSFVTASNVTVGIRISDATGVVIYGVNTRLLGQDIAVNAGSVLEVVFRLNLQLAPGAYQLTAAVHEGADHLERCYHWVDCATRFECQTTDDMPPGAFTGVDASAETRVIA